MNKDKEFLIQTPDLKDDVELIGKVEASKPIEKNGITFWGLTKRFLCVNCKKGFHNQFEDDKVCRKNGCKCYCQIGYIGRNGKTIIEWGLEDNSKINLDFFNTGRKEIDNLIEQSNLDWKLIQNEKLPRKRLNGLLEADYNS